MPEQPGSCMMPSQSIQTADFNLEMDQVLAPRGLVAGTDLANWDQAQCLEWVPRGHAQVQVQGMDLQLRLAHWPNQDRGQLHHLVLARETAPFVASEEQAASWHWAGQPRHFDIPCDPESGTLAH